MGRMVADDAGFSPEGDPNGALLSDLSNCFDDLSRDPAIATEKSCGYPPDRGLSTKVRLRAASSPERLSRDPDEWKQRGGKVR